LALTEALHDPYLEVRSAAAGVLARKGDKRARAKIREHLDSGWTYWDRTALLAAEMTTEADHDALALRLAVQAGLDQPPRAEAPGQPGHLAGRVSPLDAVRSLGQMVADSGTAREAILKAARSPRPSLRREAMRALRGFPSEQGAPLAPLIAGLRDEDRLVRALAAEGLGDLGEVARPALVDLEGVAGDLDERAEVRDEARWAIERIQGR
jgi:HEAT repeat protein